MTDKNLQILIVDDNEMASELLSEFVELLGYSTKTTANGQDAITVCAQYRPDVVITDIVLPDLNGYELAALLRAKFGKNLRIIALSGMPQDNHCEKTATFDAWLDKPLDLSALQRLLTQPGETTP